MKHIQKMRLVLQTLLLKGTSLLRLVLTNIFDHYIKYTEIEDGLHGVLQELWYNIPSRLITSLGDDSRFPSNPDVVNILRQFDAPFNFHRDYGQRLTAYLQVHNSSYYFFSKIVKKSEKKR